MSDSDALLKLVSRLQRLEALPRTGWLVSGVPRPESVSAHVFEVSLVALWIADTIDDEVDIEKLLRMALLHDVGEALTSDIPTPAKRLIGRDVVREAETRALERVLEDAPPQWADAVTAYDHATSLEARIVKAADTVQMLARALAYQAAGQGDLRRFFSVERDDYGIALVRELLDELHRRYDDRDWFVADFD